MQNSSCSTTSVVFEKFKLLRLYPCQKEFFQTTEYALINFQVESNSFSDLEISTNLPLPYFVLFCHLLATFLCPHASYHYIYIPSVQVFSITFFNICFCIFPLSPRHPEVPRQIKIASQTKEPSKILRTVRKNIASRSNEASSITLMQHSQYCLGH